MRRGDERDLRMMQDPERWPLWPILPLKKFIKQGEMPDLAVLLVHNGMGPFYVAKGDMYELQEKAKKKEEWDKLETTRYNSLEQVLDEGWVVD